MAIFHFPLFFSSALIITTSSTWIFIGFSLYFWLRLSFSTTKSCHLFHALSLHRLMYLYNFLQLHLSSSGKSSNSLTSMSTIWKGMHSSIWFLGSLLNRVPFVSCLQVWSSGHLPTCQKRGKLLIFASQRTNVTLNSPTCQRRANYSTWLANLPKACQLFNLACQRAKAMSIFQLFFKKKLIFEFFIYA